MKGFKKIYESAEKIVGLLNAHHANNQGTTVFYLNETLEEYSKGAVLDLVFMKYPTSLRPLYSVIDIEQSAMQVSRRIVCFEYSAWLIERGLVASGAPLSSTLNAIKKKQQLDNYEIKKGPWVFNKETVSEEV